MLIAALFFQDNVAFSDSLESDSFIFDVDGEDIGLNPGNWTLVLRPSESGLSTDGDLRVSHGMLIKIWAARLAYLPVDPDLLEWEYIKAKLCGDSSATSPGSGHMDVLSASEDAGSQAVSEGSSHTEPTDMDIGSDEVPMTDVRLVFIILGARILTSFIV